MGQQKRNLAVLVGILGLVFLAVACSKDGDATRPSERIMANPAVEIVEVGIELDPEKDLERHPSGYIVRDFHVARGGTVRWINKTDGTVVIEISDHRIFGSRITQEVAPGADGAWTSPPVDEKVPDGRYEYAVYMYFNEKYADGEHSNPGMYIP